MSLAAASHERSVEERGQAPPALVRASGIAARVSGLGNLPERLRLLRRREVVRLEIFAAVVVAGADQQQWTRGDPRHQVDQRRRRQVARQHVSAAVCTA